MGVTSLRFTQYCIYCDCCGIGDVIADSSIEEVHSKQQAIKWASMHKVKDGRIMCNECFNQYKYNKQKVR